MEQLQAEINAQFTQLKTYLARKEEQIMILVQRSNREKR